MAKRLRPYQDDVKSRIYKAWSDGFKNVLAVMPTGGGKTVTFCSIAIDKAIAEMVAALRLPTAILVHRKELVQQICLTLAEEGIKHNIIAPTPVIKGIIAAERRLYKVQFYDYNAPVTVISVDTLNSRILKHESWAKSIRLWITDEATHLLKNNKWGRAVSYFPNAIGLGVTATPERLDKRGLGSHVDGVFDAMVEGPSTRWMIDQGFLAKYKLIIPKSDYNLHLKAATPGADYSKEAMIVASQQSHIVGDVISNYIKFASGKQAIVFASDIGAGKKMETEAHAAGIKAKLLTGETDDQTRLNSLIDYTDKKIQMIINVDLFDEGLDVPGIEVVIHARPTKSITKYLQMCGRGLRQVFAPGFDLTTREGRLAAAAAGPKPFALIIDHVGNIKEHGLLDDVRNWTLDRIAKRKIKLNLIRICKNIDCNSPYDRLLHKCPYCGTEDEPASRGGGGGRVSPSTVDGDLVLLDPDTLRNLDAKSRLEDPAAVAKRVEKAAGPIAAKRALNNQIARIETQKQLIEVVALWAGHMRAQNLSDRMINKLFYLRYEKTISEALGEPRADMLELIEELSKEVGHVNKDKYDKRRTKEIMSDPEAWKEFEVLNESTRRRSFTEDKVRESETQLSFDEE